MSDKEETREIMNAIDFGMEVESFIKSKIGQYLIKRAEDEVADALEAMKEVEAEDSKAIRKLQDQIKRAESIQYWMAEAIQEGINAERLLIESGDA